MGNLIAVGADGRGGRIKVLRSLNQSSSVSLYSLFFIMTTWYMCLFLKVDSWLHWLVDYILTVLLLLLLLSISHCKLSGISMDYGCIINLLHEEVAVFMIDFID